MSETWIPLPSAPDYEVSDLGRVLGPRKVLSPRLKQDGYLHVVLIVDGRRLCRTVHRLVCEAFHGPCPEGKECRHRDGTRTNNVPENLCWGTRAENQADRLGHGTHQFGTSNVSAKLSTNQALEIYRRTQAGERPRDLSREFGVNQSNVSNIKNGRKWRWLTHPSIRQRF